jgi:hypothetical protein
MIPVFVYVARTAVNEAIAMSLVIVGISSAGASIRYFKKGSVNRRLVVLFVVPGVAASFIGARIAGAFSSDRLLLMFGILMTVISVILFAKSGEKPGTGPAVCRPGLALSIFAGSLIGFLTGLLGVGGGFLIVPAIALLMRCSLQTAIGTSLVIIAVNSFTGFIGHLSTMHVDFGLTAVFLASTAAGAFAGARYSGRFSTAALQKGFAVLIFAVGCLITFQHLNFK